jgi:hypothetical protein
VVLIIFSFFEIRTNPTPIQRKSMLVFAYCLFVFQVGMRWETGTDWYSYFYNFRDTTSFSIVLENTLVGYEIGYGIVVYIFRLFTENYSVFLFSHAVVYYFLFLKASKFLSPYPFLSLLIFYASTMGILGSNRQLIALVICFYSLQFILKNKPIKFFILVFIAFLFHMSALMFLVYYFFNRDFNKRLIVVVLLLAIVIGQSSIPSYLFVQFSGLLGETAASKAEMYSTRPLSATANSFIGLVRRLLFFFVFLFSYDKIVKKFPIYKMLFNGWTLGLLIYFMFASSFVILVGRGGFYFTIMECFLLASLLFLFKGKHRVFLFAALSVYSFFILYQSISEYPHLFLPYKGLFINTSFERTWEIF